MTLSRLFKSQECIGFRCRLWSGAVLILGSSTTRSISFVGAIVGFIWTTDDWGLLSSLTIVRLSFV